MLNKIIKIEGINRGLIRVFIDDMNLLISGELTTTPVFYANLNSIIKWENSGLEICKEDKEQIIKLVIEFSENSQIKIFFD